MIPFPDKKVSSRAPVWGASGIGSRNLARYKFQVVPPCGGHLGGIPEVPPRLRLPGFKSCPRVGGISRLH